MSILSYVAEQYLLGTGEIQSSRSPAFYESTRAKRATKEMPTTADNPKYPDARQRLAHIHSVDYPIR